MTHLTLLRFALSFLKANLADLQAEGNEKAMFITEKDIDTTYDMIVENSANFFLTQQL